MTITQIIEGQPFEVSDATLEGGVLVATALRTNWAWRNRWRSVCVRHHEGGYAAQVDTGFEGPVSRYTSPVPSVKAAVEAACVQAQIAPPWGIP